MSTSNDGEKTGASSTIGLCASSGNHLAITLTLYKKKKTSCKIKAVLIKF